MLSQSKEVIIKKILLFIIITFPLFLCASAIGEDITISTDEEGGVVITKGPPPPGADIKEIIKVREKKPENKPDIPGQIEKETQEELATGRERLEKSIKELKEKIKRVEKMIVEDKANIELQKDYLSKAKKFKRRWRSINYIKKFETNIHIANNNYKNHENILRDLKQDLADAEKRLQEI